MCPNFSLLGQVLDILIRFSCCPNYGNFILFLIFLGKKLVKFLNFYIFIFPQNQLLTTRDTVKNIDLGTNPSNLLIWFPGPKKLKLWKNGFLKNLRGGQIFFSFKIMQIYYSFESHSQYLLLNSVRLVI